MADAIKRFMAGRQGLIPALMGVNDPAFLSMLQREQTERNLESDAQAREANAPGLMASLQAAGIDTRQVPGLMGALESGGANVANQLMANPQAPLMAGRQALVDAEAQQQAQANQIELAKLQQAEADRAAERVQSLRPYRMAGRSIENVRSMKNLLADEGRLVVASPERGAYNSLRGQLLNTLRQMFEAGALQQAELEFFQTLLPDASTFSTTSQGERMAMINELEYQLTSRLADDLFFSGEEGLTVDMFAGPGRSIDQLVTGGLPAGFQPGTGDAQTRSTENRAAPEAPIQPGMSIF